MVSINLRKGVDGLVPKPTFSCSSKVTVHITHLAPGRIYKSGSTLMIAVTVKLAVIVPKVRRAGSESDGRSHDIRTPFGPAYNARASKMGPSPRFVASLIQLS
jgi:hypothetical protein